MDFSQKTDYKNEAAYKFSSSEISKGLPSFSNDILSSSVTENVNEKVLKQFNKKFINAGNVTWEQLDDNFLATFVIGETTTKSLFNKNGKLIYTIDIFSEKKLPNSVKSVVMNNYKNYSITSVARILQDNRKIWIVKLAGKTDYKAAKIEEVENFQRVN